jgi:hypothetical protein
MFRRQDLIPPPSPHLQSAYEAAMKTQGEIEAIICEKVNRFLQDYMGRGQCLYHPSFLTKHAEQAR